MSTLEVRLFGALRISRDGEAVDLFEGSKALELFCYLLLHRDRPHLRETVADQLWGEASPASPRKHLRQSLWQLHALLDRGDGAGERILVSGAEQIGLNSGASLWLDVAAFERACEASRGMEASELDGDRARTLQEAADLYRGNLLEGWPQDWCIFERERLQVLFLTTLDRLIAYCELQHEYELGVAYGLRILQIDTARERTHRALMRLYYLGGHRTEALRQFEACATALQTELGVRPSRSTLALYERIRSGGTKEAEAMAGEPVTPAPTRQFTRLQTPIQAEQITRALNDVQRQLSEVGRELGHLRTLLSERR